MSDTINRRDFLRGVIIAGAPLILPKISEAIILPENREVSLKEPIIAGGHFSWSEATKNGTRIPSNPTIVRNITHSAEYMEWVRKYFGSSPVIVTSWYRTPSANRLCGGTENSQHLTGRAVDFKIPGIPAREVYNKLDEPWGNRGGLGNYPTFTHIDNRGHKSRWFSK